MEIGRQSSALGLSILGMKLILVHFHSVGNTDNLMHLLIIYVSRYAILPATNLTKLIGVLSLPVQQSLRILFTSWRVSLQDADRNLKLGIFTDDGDMLMIYVNTCKSALFLPVNHFDVVLKCLLSSFGLIQMRLQFGLRVLCITFKTLLDFLLDNALR